MRVFLGGTCNDSTWRDALIPELKHNGIEYFNPVVADWNPECMAKENAVKNDPNTVNLFVITSDMTGVFSIAESVHSAHIKPNKTLFCVKTMLFSDGQLRSLMAVEKLITEIGGKCCRFSEIVATLLAFKGK